MTLTTAPRREASPGAGVGAGSVVIAPALAAYARASNRTFEARVQTIGASEIGACLRRNFFIKAEGSDFGTARDPDFTEGWGAPTRGTVFERAFWEPALRAQFGDRLLFAGGQQETLALGFLSGTPDGLIVGLDSDVLAPLGVPDLGGDGSLLLEAKTVDPRTRPDGLPKNAHVYQVQVGLGLVHALTRHRPEFGLVGYTDASYWDLTYEFPIRRDPTVFAVAQSRARQILAARSAAALAPEGRVTAGESVAFVRSNEAVTK